MDILVTLFDPEDIFSLMFAAEFAMIALVGIYGVLTLIRLDHGVHKFYDERVEVFSTFFQTYEKERLKKEQEEMEKYGELLEEA